MSIPTNVFHIGVNKYAIHCNNLHRNSTIARFMFSTKKKPLINKTQCIYLYKTARIVKEKDILSKNDYFHMNYGNIVINEHIVELNISQHVIY